MAEAKKDINEELLVKVTEEVHLLYHMEKEISKIKSDVEWVSSLRSEIDEMKKEKERVRKNIERIKRFSILVLFAALAAIIVLSVVSCDAFVPDWDSLFEDSEENEKAIFSGTSWICENYDSPYIYLYFSSDGTSCTATDSSNIPIEGIVLGDVVILDDISYNLEISDDKLSLISGSYTYVYKRHTT